MIKSPLKCNRNISKRGGGRIKKQNVLTVEEQLVTVNERIQEVENELKQLRSQRKEILEKIEEQKKETLFRAVIASGRIVEDVLAILKAQDQKKEQ